MRAKRRTVIDLMYIEDADLMNVLRIIMGGPEGLLNPVVYPSINVVVKAKISLKPKCLITSITLLLLSENYGRI